MALWFQINGLDLSMFYEGGVEISGFAIDMIVHAQLSWQLLAVLCSAVFVATLFVAYLSLGRLKRINIAEVLR